MTIAIPGHLSGRDATLIKAVVEGIVPEIRSQFRAEIEPLKAENAALIERIAELEAREMPSIEGLCSVDEARELVAQAIADIPGPEPDSALNEIERRLSEVEAREIPEAIKGDPGEVDMDMVAEMLSERVSEAIKAIPAPQDGKDGIGLADALKDESGNLVLVMTDGRTKSLGKINGEDGRDGEPGRDGLGFDDLNVEQIGERTVRFLLKRDMEEAEFDLTLPYPIYRHVFKAGERYERGDLVTWGGSLWHCDKDTGEKPDGSADWSLAARKGRDGKSS